MALGFMVSNAVAQSMQTALATATDVGTAACIAIYDGAVPADCGAAPAGNVLAQLTCATTMFTATTAANPSVLTAGAIASDTSADSTGTASFFRIHTQSDKVTTIAQGTVGTATCDLILNTVSITSGSTVAITAATISLPTG